MRINIIGEKFLLTGFFLTPFTSLRFGFFGIGEVLILISALIAIATSSFILKLDYKIRTFTYFWFYFIFISLVGFFFNYSFNYNSGEKFGSAVFDLLSYLFIFLAVLTTGHYSSINPTFSVKFFKSLFFYWGCIYLILYGLFVFNVSVFGISLHYHGYFLPLVDNIHQAASLTCAMAFVMFYIAKESNKFIAKVFYILCSLGFILMAIDSGSTKAFLGVLVGALVGLIIFIGYRRTGSAQRALNTISLIVIFLLVFFILYLFSDYIYFTALNFFIENDGDGARKALYSNGFEHGLKSFIVGYGPGAHALYEGEYLDAHNTILTIFLQSGILGVFVFLWFVIRLTRNLSIDFVLIATISAASVYVFGGDVLRRLPIWLVLMGLVYFARSRTADSFKNSLVK